MKTMTPEQEKQSNLPEFPDSSSEKQWREEFEKWDFIIEYKFPLSRNKFGSYSDSRSQDLWLGYFAARTKAQEEIDGLEKRLIDKQENHDIYYAMMEEKFTALKGENELLKKENEELKSFPAINIYWKNLKQTEKLRSLLERSHEHVSHRARSYPRILYPDLTVNIEETAKLEDALVEWLKEYDEVIK